MNPFNEVLPWFPVPLLFFCFLAFLVTKSATGCRVGTEPCWRKPRPWGDWFPELWVLHPEAVNPEDLIWKRKWVLFHLSNIYNSFISLSTIKAQGIIRKSRYFAILGKSVSWQAWIFANSGSERQWLPWRVAHTLCFVTISATTLRIFLDTHTDYETLMINGLLSASSLPMYLIHWGPAWFFRALESSWSSPSSSLHPSFLFLSTL